MSKTRPVPDLGALGDFAVIAASNARRLLDDADLLLRRGRYPTAYSVAVLAFEEAGKAWACITAMGMPGDVRPEWPFGELIATHVDKLMSAHAMAHLLAFVRGGEGAPASLADIADDLEMLAREHDKAKQRGFYADLLDDGTVRDPAQVSRDEATQMVRTVRDLLDHGAPLADPGFIAWLAEEPEDEDLARYRAEFWDAFTAGARRGTAAGMAEAIEGFLDQAGVTEGLREMLQAQEAARTAAPPRVTRTQPRRLPRAQRRS